MTAYEYADIAASNYTISFTLLSLLVALASAYFVAAYAMGKSLSVFQVSLLNIVYGLWMSGLAWIASRFLIRATEVGLLALSLDENQSGEVFTALPAIPHQGSLSLAVVTSLAILHLQQPPSLHQ